MKIGYLQFNNPVELDFGAATNLGCDIRLGILESMVAQGHQVTILSPMKKSHEHMLTPKRRPTAPWIKYDFLDGVGYEWVKDRDLDVDLLFIQYGPTNTMFGYAAPNEDYRALYGNRVPYMHRSMAVTENFEGPVVYYQNDHLPIPLGEIDYGLPLHEVSSHNLRNVMGRFNPFNGTKNWMILTTSFDIPKFKTENSSRRYMYHEKPFRFKYVPLFYSPNVFPYLPPQEDVLMDLIYVGAEGDKTRNERLSSLMRAGQPHEFRKAIVGEWSDEARNKFFKGADDIYFLPPVPQGRVRETLNDSLCSIQVLKKSFHTFGMMTMRAIEVIRSGSVLLMDGTIPGYRDYVDDEWAVFTRSDVVDKLNAVKALSYAERKAVSEAQNERLRTWNSLSWRELFAEVVG